MQGRPRIEDVAEMASVSTATVSRVLSDPELVRPERRARVLNAVQLLGYAPDVSAQALASGKTRTIGCIVPFLDQAIFARSTQALQRVLLAQQYQLLIATHEYDSSAEFDSVRNLLQRGVDALVLVGTDHDPRTWRAVKTWGKPTVLTWSCDPRLQSIGFDNRSIAAELTQHLIDLGHRDIGVISGFIQTNDRARSRLEGVRGTMARAGLRLRDEFVSFQSFNLQGGQKGVDVLMGQKRRPTAIVCGNDLLAAGALTHAIRQGICVPSELSICGIDNNELSQAIVPALTTVELSAVAIGEATAQHLMGALDGIAQPKKTLLPYRLIIRESTGPNKRR